MPWHRCCSHPVDWNQLPDCKPYLLMENHIYCSYEHLWFRVACLATKYGRRKQRGIICYGNFLNYCLLDVGSPFGCRWIGRLVHVILRLSSIDSGIGNHGNWRCKISNNKRWRFKVLYQSDYPFRFVWLQLNSRNCWCHVYVGHIWCQTSVLRWCRLLSWRHSRLTRSSNRQPLLNNCIYF